jgi:allantoin racemase
MKALYTQIEDALQNDGSEAIVLGCAGMVELQQALQSKYQVPVIEGVTAAVSIMQGMARLPTSTSRRNTYAGPLAKQYQGFFARYSPNQ